jgi:predicted enzyme related to lactoylglutathione lyase
MVMFFKIGFFVLLFLVILMVWVFMRSNPMTNQGANGWTEFYSSNPTKTIKFLGDTFGIKSQAGKDTPTGMDYKVLKAPKQLWPFAGIMDIPNLPNGKKADQKTMVYLTVKNYDEAHKKMLKNGAKAYIDHQSAGGMKFGIYEIPGGVAIGIAQYGK